MRPDRAARALGAIVRDLVETSDGATYFAGRVWGVSLRYDLGADHPLVGRAAPDFKLVDGTRLNEHLRTGHGLLLDFDGRASLRKLASGWSGRIDYVAGDAKAHLGVSAFLVRPDGFVAWATDLVDGEDAAAQAMLKWFGPHQATSA